MILPVRQFPAFCHPDCEHREKGYCNRFHHFLTGITTAGFVNAYVRDPWCVVEETEKHGTLTMSEDMVLFLIVILLIFAFRRVR